ncbi:MAG: YraN family protein [Syntrophales bacterium]|nr:YraN family protein [Syntrophales bacterium]
MARRRSLVGHRGEEEAVKFLTRKGYRILERNYRCPLGEIDIVASDGSTLVFAEVKSRSSDSYGDPLESVTLEKQRRISLVALHYIQRRKLYNVPARFDVITVKMGNGDVEISLIKDAFELQVG